MAFAIRLTPKKFREKSVVPLSARKFLLSSKPWGVVRVLGAIVLFDLCDAYPVTILQILEIGLG